MCEIESPSTFYIEKSTFKWCGGDVYTPSARFRLKEKNYDIVLYCSQLNLTDVLKEIFGLQGEGQGHLSGRIPVKWRDEELIVDKGYLHSTPGEGGELRLDADSPNAANAIIGAPVAGALSQSKMGFAKEALKDFHYDWAKVTINSENNLLKTNLDLAGRPNKPIQVEYGSEIQTACPPMRFEFRVNTFSVNEFIQGTLGFNVKKLLPTNQ